MNTVLDNNNILYKICLSYDDQTQPSTQEMSNEVWFSRLKDTGYFSIEEKNKLSQVLIDSFGNYWLVERKQKWDEKVSLYVFNREGMFLNKWVLNGRSRLFELGDQMIAECEGTDGKGWIYGFRKDTQRLDRKWRLDGFLWGLEKVGKYLCVSAYLYKENLAVMYVMNGNELFRVDLGKGFFSTNLLYANHFLYVAVCPVLGDSGGEIICLDRDFHPLRRYPMDSSPRHLFSYGQELIIHTAELLENHQEKLIYCHPETGGQVEHVIPKTYKIKRNGDHLFFIHLKEQSVIQWDLNERRIAKINHMEGKTSKHVVDFHCVNHRSTQPSVASRD